jgi:hypothetical protein
MAQTGNVGITRHERSRNGKVLLCKEKWKEKQRRMKKFLAIELLNMKDKIAYESNN